MQLGKFSFGIGDRFTYQGKAQLRAVMRAIENGIHVTPVWNKSNREHIYVGTKPSDTRSEADEAVKALGYSGSYFVDADHVNLDTVEDYIEVSDFFTLDVAKYIGQSPSGKEAEAFISSCSKYIGELSIPGIEQPFKIDRPLIWDMTDKFLFAAKYASEIYSFLKEKKAGKPFITEISFDEVATAQTPIEMFFILKMLADAGVKMQTIAPKFTGRFNKGVDYLGNIEQFAKEFEQDILVLDYAAKAFGLPKELKLSVHSGSDKFSIYPIMADIIKKYDKGLHIKTAGTTWLEEVIGLAVAGGDGLELAKEIYEQAYHRIDELCKPYADVIAVEPAKLPLVTEVRSWDSCKFANTLRHIPEHPDYNPNFRQLLHVAYKVAAEMEQRYTGLLVKYSDVIGSCVEENIYERHLKRLFKL